MDRLFKLDANGAVQIWTIEKFKDSLTITWGQLHGVMQHQFIKVNSNQSGRSLPEQVYLEADSRINKQIYKGYCKSIEEAKLSIGLNASKYFKPMLAIKMSNSNVDYKKCFIQRKYDGHRCLITNDGKNNIAYSRNGKKINTINHILENIDIEPGITLDGELYIHGEPLQTISSIVRRVQDNNIKLKYIAYDTISNNNYDRRLVELQNYNLSDSVIIAPTIHGNDINDLNEELHNSINEGYEGLILRTNDKCYEPGKRSKSLIKLKEFQDDEFLITGILESKDGWAILECITKDGHEFRVSAPGTIEEKINILINAHDYIGEYINIEYFTLTANDIPFHPIAKYFI